MSAIRPPDVPTRPLARAADAGDLERRLREMTAILDTATDGVLILDKDGVIESVNASAEALFGLETREIRAAISATC